MLALSIDGEHPHIGRASASFANAIVSRRANPARPERNSCGQGNHPVRPDTDCRSAAVRTVRDEQRRLCAHRRWRTAFATRAGSPGWSPGSQAEITPQWKPLK